MTAIPGTHDLFCVTHGPDAEWTLFMLRSVQKYARGFRNVVVVYPSKHRHLLEPICTQFGNCKRCEIDEPENDGHMRQNLTKCKADIFSDADYIHHIDADCMVVSEYRPEMHFTEGRPDLLYSLFSKINSPWQGITQRALGRSVDVETMRRFPFVYPRFLYGALRDRVQRVHGIDFDKYVLTAPGIGGAWRGFSEFCSLGALAKYFYPDRFFFYETEIGMKPTQMKQYWTHSHITPHEREEIERITRDFDKPQPFDV